MSKQRMTKDNANSGEEKVQSEQTSKEFHHKIFGCRVVFFPFLRSRSRFLNKIYIHSKPGSDRSSGKNIEKSGENGREEY